MAELKTKINDKSVDDFLNSVPEEKKRKDSYTIKKIMEEITGEPAKMWGDSIVGFGSYHYKSKSGQEGDWMLTAFSPRKQSLTVYIMPGFERYEHLMDQLGKYKTGKSCLYIKKLEDVDMEVLKELVEVSVKHMREESDMFIE